MVKFKYDRYLLTDSATKHILIDSLNRSSSFLTMNLLMFKMFFSDSQIHRNAHGFSYCENLVERYDNTLILIFFTNQLFITFASC